MADRDRSQRRDGPRHIPAQEASMAPSVVALRRGRRRVMTTPEETPSAVLTHLALAITRYVRQLRKDELPVPPMIDELAAFLTLYVRTRQAATGVDGDYGTPHDVPVVRRLLITKAEARNNSGYRYGRSNDSSPRGGCRWSTWNGQRGYGSPILRPMSTPWSRRTRNSLNNENRFDPPCGDV